MKRTAYRYGTAQILAATALWGTTGATQAVADLDVSPAALGGVRILSGGLLLLAAHRHGIRRHRAWGPLLAASAATGLFQPAYLMAVSRSGVALATAIVFGVAPVAIALLGRAPLGLRWWAGTAAAITGCALLLLPGAAGGANAAGAVLAAVSGCCYAVYTVSAKRLTDDPGAISLTLLLGGLPLLPWVMADATALAAPRGLAVIVWLGPVTTAAAYLLFVRGLRHVPTATAGTLSLTEPLVAALLGVLLLHEHLTAPAVAGCVLVLSGLVLARPQPEHEPRDDEHDPTPDQPILRPHRLHVAPSHPDPWHGGGPHMS